MSAALRSANLVPASARVMPLEHRHREARRLLDNVDEATTRMRTCDLNADRAFFHVTSYGHAAAAHRRLSKRADRYRRYICRALDHARALLERGAS